MHLCGGGARVPLRQRGSTKKHILIAMLHEKCLLFAPGVIFYEIHSHSGYRNHRDEGGGL